MKYAKYLGLAVALLLLMPAGAFAKEKTEHTVKLYQPVLVGSTQLAPGNYKVEWQGTGHAVAIKFLHNGKTVLSTTGNVIAKNRPPQADEVMMRKTSKNQERLEELDFGNHKEALLFPSHTNPAK
jgi:hypothetical protein